VRGVRGVVGVYCQCDGWAVKCGGFEGWGVGEVALSGGCGGGLWMWGWRVVEGGRVGGRVGGGGGGGGGEGRTYRMGVNRNQGHLSVKRKGMVHHYVNVAQGVRRGSA